MTRLLALALVLALAGCGERGRVLVKTEVVEVPRYVRATVPAALTAPIAVPWPAPACQRDGAPVLCNGQVADLLLEHRRALATCNADRAAIRAGEGTP